MAGNSTEPGRSVTSRVAAILLSFVDTGVHSLTEIARLTGLPVSTAHRLAVELTSRHLLERDEQGQYRVTPLLRQLGASMWHTPTLAERGPCVLEDLFAATRTTARLGIVSGLSVRYIEKRNYAPVTSFEIVAQVPIHATAMGKALLAFSPRRLVDNVISNGLTEFTRQTISAPHQLRHNLTMVRQTQVAVSYGELKTGSDWVAVPVIANGNAIAALELQLQEHRRDLPLATTALFTACRCLARELSAGDRVQDFLDKLVAVDTELEESDRRVLAG